MASAGVVGLLRILLLLDTGQFESGVGKAKNLAVDLEKSYAKLGDQFRIIGGTMTAGLTVPIVAFGAAVLKASADFEFGFANIKKTVGQVGGSVQASTVYYKELEQFIRSTAKSMPQTTEELSRIAALGGQFGISAEGLQSFTKTIATLDIAVSDLSGEEAAKGLAQLRNIAHSSEADISRMAAALVTLGNNGASTEGDILELSKRIAGAGINAGLTVPQIMGLSAAVANVGINVEAGGTAVSRTLNQMSAAVATGGSKLEAFAKIAGMSVDDFSNAFKTKPVAAVQAFLEGLSRSRDAGENMTLILKDMGAEGVRQADVLNRLSLGVGDVKNQLDLAGASYQENEAHNVAAAEKMKTFWNELKVLRGQIKDVAIELGASLMPVLKDMIQVATPIVKWIGDMATGFNALPEPVRMSALAILGIVAALGPVISVAGYAYRAMSAFVGIFKAGGFISQAPGMISAIGTAFATAAPYIGAFAVAGVALYATYRAGSEIWGLYTDRAEQAKLATAQNVSHQRVLADASKVAGREITNLAEGLAILREKAAKSLLENQKLAVSHQQAGQHAQMQASHTKTLTDALAANKALVASLSKEQIANIAAGKTMGLSTKEITNKLNELYPGLRMTEEATKLVTDSMEKHGKTAQEVAEGPLKKFKNRVIELEAQMASASKEGPKAYKVAIEELGDQLVDADAKAKIFGVTLSKELVAAIQAAQAKARDAWAHGIVDKEMATGGVDIKMGGANIDATERDLKTQQDAQKSLLKSFNDAEMQKLQATLAAAQRRNASAKETQAIERQILAEQLDASIRTAQQEFVEKTRLLDTETELGRKAYHDAEVAHQASVANMVANYRAGIAAQVTLSQQLKTAVLGVFEGIPATLARAFEGGGSIAGAFASIGIQIAEAIRVPIVKTLTVLQRTAVTAGGAAATAFGGVTGGGLGASVASVAAGLGGAALAATAWGTSMAAAGAGGALALGAATAGIGVAAVGAALLAKHIFGVSGEVKKARTDVAAFQQSLNSLLTEEQKAEAGGEQWKQTLILVRDAYIKTGRSAAEAEAIVQQLWNTDNPLASAAAMQTINGVLKEQTDLLKKNEEALAANKATANDLFDEIMKAGSEGIPAALRGSIDQLIGLGLLTEDQAKKLQGLGTSGGVNVAKMTAAMDVFKGRVESLGPAFKQAQINETAQKYINAIDLMIKGGGDVGGILFDAREELGALVEDSMKSGKTLPANMKPWIDDLVASGSLLDSAGRKITDVSGLKYGEAMKTEAEVAKEGWDKIILKIQELIDKIANPLSDALDKATKDRTVNIGVNVDDPNGILAGNRGGNTTMPVDTPYAGPFSEGTIGRFGQWWGRFPKTGAHALLHDNEAVLRTQDAVPFSLDTLAGLGMLQPQSAASSPVASSDVTTNNHQQIFIAIPQSAAGDTSAIVREVFRQMPSSIQMNEAGVRSGIERVIEDYERTYGRG